MQSVHEILNYDLGRRPLSHGYPLQRVRRGAALVPVIHPLMLSITVRHVHYHRS